MIIVVAIHFGNLAVLRPLPGVPRADRLAHYECWRHACEWAAKPQNIPSGARFLTPRMSQTFKWYAGHSEVINWKDIPQDACSIVEWWRRMHDIHGNPDGRPFRPWHRSLALRDEQRLQELGEKYNADYLLTEAQPRLDFPVVYKNPAYIIYKLNPGEADDK